MSSLAVASLVFVCVFGSALIGLFLRPTLPKPPTGEDALDVVRTGTGLIATLAAVVLGLLIASASASFDKTKDEVSETAAKVVQLDRVLADYGPETKEARALLRDIFGSMLETVFPEKGYGLPKIDDPERRAKFEHLQAMLNALTPRNDAQRSLQSRAVDVFDQMAELRWLVIVQGESALPAPFLIVMVLWLAIIFAGLGLLSTKHPAVIAILVIWALSVAGAILLIDEMSRPLEGFMRISSAPLRNALIHLGQ